MIRKGLLWSAGKNRFANILKEDQSGADWFVHEYKSWTNFRVSSLKYIEGGYNWVVFADVSAYFENISIQRLISDLRALGLSSETRSVLSACLNRWAEPKARGIPQGSLPSSILAEVYFDSIDQRLANKKIEFCRYVDDIRLFCKSKNEAIGALNFLTVLLREKELNLQTAKSFIKADEDARNEIDSISNVVAEMEKDIKNELRNFIQYDAEYATPSLIETFMAGLDKEIKLHSIRKAFDHFLTMTAKDFDKTLFHYCINRLGAADDDYAVEFCLTCIVERPEEYVHILSYFSKLENRRILLAESTIDSFKDETNILNRHYFLLLRWIYDEKLNSEKTTEFCREIAFRSDLDDYTKHYSWAILGEFGNLADLDAIEAEYARVSRDISKATVICSIRRMVEDRRNAMYSRAEQDSLLVNFAIKTSKTKSC